MEENEILVIKGFNAQINPTIATQIKNFELQVKDIKAKEEELKNKILDAMRTHRVEKIESPELTITYIAPTKRETLDSKKLKEEKPDIYLEYVQVSDVKDSIRLKII